MTRDENDYIWSLHFDGASRGNPGPSSYGFVLQSTTNATIEDNQAIGETTNNCAEYEALIAGLERALDQGITRLNVYGDSQLIIKQVRGDWAVNDHKMQERHSTVKDLLKDFERVDFSHKPREANERADELANQALD
jgi:ribonuclease HI